VVASHKGCSNAQNHWYYFISSCCCASITCNVIIVMCSFKREWIYEEWRMMTNLICAESTSTVVAFSTFFLWGGPIDNVDADALILVVIGTSTQQYILMWLGNSLTSFMWYNMELHVLPFNSLKHNVNLYITGFLKLGYMAMKVICLCLSIYNWRPMIFMLCHSGTVLEM